MGLFMMFERFDRNSLPIFSAWKKGWSNEEQIDLRFFSKITGNIELAIAYSELFWPKFREVRGCYVRDFENVEYDETKIPANMSLAEQQGKESMYNHVHLYDAFPNQQQGTPLAAYEHLAQMMLHTWRCALELQFPGVKFEFYYDTEPDEYGPTISCWHVE
jgi:hypothetical protein